MASTRLLILCHLICEREPTVGALVPMCSAANEVYASAVDSVTMIINA